MIADQRTFSELLKDFAFEVRTLLQQELLLLKTEMSEKASEIGKGLGLVVMGAMLLLGCYVTGIAALVVGLLTWMHPLVALLTVSGLLALAGYACLQKGRTVLQQLDPAPRKTLMSLKEDAQWVTREMP